MKRILHSITGVSVAAVVVLAGLSNPVLLAQSNEPNKAKGSESAKVNLDGNGVILKGHDAVGYFEQGKADQREFGAREHLTGRQILICLGIG